MKFLHLIMGLYAVLITDFVVSSHHSKRRHHNSLHSQTTALEDSLFQHLDFDEMMALQHSERVAEASSCGLPKLQVVHVSDHYPGRYYLPHCTLLHRCGKHAGCCGSDRLRCVAAEKERVVLHFYSVKILEDGSPTKRKIEKLTFTNHTKCGCVPVDNL